MTDTSTKPFRCSACQTTVWPDAPFGDGGSDGLHDRCKLLGSYDRPAVEAHVDHRSAER